MERRRLAGMKPASLAHHRKVKRFKQGVFILSPNFLLCKDFG
jgi:hypothetical protein